jgi:hypothetical protein
MLGYPLVGLIPRIAIRSGLSKDSCGTFLRLKVPPHENSTNSVRIVLKIVSGGQQLFGLYGRHHRQ